MRAVAGYAVRRRWIVVGAWIALVVALQGILSGVGGAHYNDDFTLPHTETETVSALLTASGLDGRNGASGTIVLHAAEGDITGPPRRFSRCCGSCARPAWACPRSSRRTAPSTAPPDGP